MLRRRRHEPPSEGPPWGIDGQANGFGRRHRGLTNHAESFRRRRQMTTLLEAHGIDKRFGGLEALTGVSLAIRHGEIYGLIGPNGAGKTTFFNVLTGFYRADRGEFLFDGKRLDVTAPHLVAHAGIARTFQNIRLFGNMSALEN